MVFAYEKFDDLPEIDGFEMKYTKLFIPSPNMAMKTIHHFYTTLDDLRAEVEALYPQIDKEEELESYRIKIHSLKSGAASMGNMTIHVLAKLIDMACRVKDYSRIKTVHPLLMEELDHCKEALDEVFSDLNTPAKEAADPKIVLPLLETLKFCIYDNDLTITDECVAELSKYAYPAEITADIKLLIKTVMNLQKDAASELTDSIIKKYTALI